MKLEHLKTNELLAEFDLMGDYYVIVYKLYKNKVYFLSLYFRFKTNTIEVSESSISYLEWETSLTTDLLEPTSITSYCSLIKLIFKKKIELL